MKVFIGSSQEQISEAEKVARWLENWNHQPVLWSDTTVFPLGDFTLESLIDISSSVDVAIFIFGADDQTWFRGKTVMSIRDNVLLEYGLFVGKLSRKRVAFLCKGKPKIASDLLNVNYADMSKPYNAKPFLKQWLDNISMELQQIQNKPIATNGGFQITDLYNAFQIAFQDSKTLENFRVFAISTFKSVQMLRLMSHLQIRYARVLLRKYAEQDLFYDEHMQGLINNAIQNWRKMAEEKNVSNLYLSFFNYHPDEGFYIIDDRYLITGYLNYSANEHKYEFGRDVFLVDNQTEVGKKWIKCYIERFEKIYANYKSEEVCLP